MARRSHQALSAAVAGACLTLCGCGASSAPAAAGSPAPAPSATAAAKSAEPTILTGHFCRDASSFMQNVPSPPTTAHTSAAKARDNLRTVLRSTVTGFTGLAAEAPGTLRTSLTKIVYVYKLDEKMLSTSGSLVRITQAMDKRNAAGSAAFRRVLTYISAHCG